MTKIMFIEARSKQDLIPALRAALPKLKQYNRIGVATTVQHLDELPSALEFLTKNRKQVLIGPAQKRSNLSSKQGVYSVHPAQILGCDATGPLMIADSVDCYLYIGTGEFHPLAIALETDKPVICANPLTETAIEITESQKRKYLAKKAARISKAKDAKLYGILTSTKPGQYYSAEKVKEWAENQGKKAVVLLADTITPEELLNFPDIDCFINTACPRMVEDQARYPKPVVNFDELREMFKN